MTNPTAEPEFSELNPQSNRRLYIRDTRQFGLLVIVLLSTATAGYLLARAQRTGQTDGPPWAALVCFALAIVALWDGRRGASMHDPAQAAAPSRRPALGPLPIVWRAEQADLLRISVAAAAVILLAVALQRIPQLGYSDRYTGIVIAWLLACAGYFYVVVPNETWRRAGGAGSAAMQLWQQARFWVLALSGTLLFAGLLRFWQLSAIPFVLGGDEGSQGLEAIRVINGEIGNPFSTGWLGVPTMSFFFNSVTIRILGQTQLALRLPWALVGVSTVLITYLLAARLRGRPAGLMAAFLVATYHYHIHFSRLGSNQIADPLFAGMALLFLYRAIDTGSRLAWALMGAVTGLAFYFYAGARFTPILVVVLLAYHVVYDRRPFITRHWRGMLTAAGGFAVIGAPMIQYALRSPNDFNARLNQVGIIQSGWINGELALGRTWLEILWGQFANAALAFNYTTDRTVWYGLQEPFLDPVFGAIFFVGLGYGTLRALGPGADRRIAPIIAWWWGGILLGGMMTVNPPSSMRLVTTTVPACIIIVYVLQELLTLAREAVAGLPARSIQTLAVSAFAVISVHTYFIEFTPQRIYGGAQAEIATELAPVLERLGPDYQPIFLGPPRMYYGFATLPYLAPSVRGIDIYEPLTAPLVSTTYIPAGRGAVFILLPERLNELAFIQTALPDGEFRQLRSPVSGVIAHLYVVAPPA